MHTSNVYPVLLILNISLSGLFTFFVTTAATTGFIAESDGVYGWGFMIAIGWVIALLMTIYTWKKKSRLWFALTLIAGWTLPIANIYIYAFIMDHFSQGM